MLNIEKLNSLSIYQLKELVKRISFQIQLSKEELNLIKEDTKNKNNHYDSLDTWRDDIFGKYKGAGESEYDATAQAIKAYNEEEIKTKLKNIVIRYAKLDKNNEQTF